MANTTVAGARASLEAYMASNYTTYPVQYQNVPFSQPSNQYWVRMTLLFDDADPGSIGTGGYNEVEGLIRFSIFTPKNVGSEAGYDICDEIRSLFNRQVIDSSVHCRAAGVPREQTDDTFFYLVFDIPFFLFERVT